MSKDLESGDVIIFTVLNDADDLWKGFHTMAASYDGSMFTVYNVNDSILHGRSVFSLREVYTGGIWIYGFQIWNNG